MIAIGRVVERLVREERKGKEVKEELDRHLWHYVSMYTKMNGAKLKKLHSVLAQQREGGGGGGGGGGAPHSKGDLHTSKAPTQGMGAKVKR